MDNYLIKKGNHYASVSLFQRLFSVGWNIRQMSIHCQFSNECWWAPPRNDDDNDLNKLCGIGYGLSHHQNSVRFAWVPDFTKHGIINIYGYTYDENTSDLETLIARADQAMYIAKHKGRNRVAVSR